jgi:hypothetical protein
MMNGPSLDWNKMQGAFGLITCLSALSNDHLIWRLAICEQWDGTWAMTSCRRGNIPDFQREQLKSKKPWSGNPRVDTTAVWSWMWLDDIGCPTHLYRDTRPIAIKLDSLTLKLSE